MKWPHFDDFGNIYFFYVVTSIKYLILFLLVETFFSKKAKNLGKRKMTSFGRPFQIIFAYNIIFAEFIHTLRFSFPQFWDCIFNLGCHLASKQMRGVTVISCHLTLLAFLLRDFGWLATRDHPASTTLLKLCIKILRTLLMTSTGLQLIFLVNIFFTIFDKVWAA